MEILNNNRWSELPMDIVRYLLERLSFVDFHRAKMVCSNWYLCSKQTLGPKGGSPSLILFPEDGCALYNHPDEDRVYKNKSDFSGFRFLGSSDKWFLVVDSRSNLYIIDVFSEKKIDLPPLESIKGGLLKVVRLRDTKFKEGFVHDMSVVLYPTVEDLRGVLWVEEKKGDYVVVWQFNHSDYVGFCKKGDDHYHEISTWIGVRTELRGLCDMVLKGYSLYVLTICYHIRHLDLSGQDGFKDVSIPMCRPTLSRDEMEIMRANEVISCSDKIVVTTSGEVLLVNNKVYESTFERHIMFHLYKRDPKNLDLNTYDTELVEIDSLGDEALFLDLGITVLADHTLGIEPNSIYFTRDDRIRDMRSSCLDICVYNIATKTIKRFPGLSSNLKLKDARWFLPS